MQKKSVKSSAVFSSDTCFCIASSLAKVNINADLIYSNTQQDAQASADSWEDTRHVFHGVP